jgi:tetratricopeptide (TPR) repeat protein
LLAEHEVVGHNLQFDLQFLARLGFTLGRVLGTLLLSQLIDGPRKGRGYHSLAGCVGRVGHGRTVARQLGRVKLLAREQGAGRLAAGRGTSRFPLRSHPMVPSRTLPLALLSAALVAPALMAQAPKEADMAYSEGVKHVNARKYKEAIGPLERALALAPDDAYRVKVYRALVPAYRTLAGPEKLTEASEFILRHSDQLSERRTAAASLAAFYFQRGLAAAQLKRYGEAYDKDNDDYAASAMTSELAKVAKGDKATAEAYRERHLKAERKLAGKLAVSQEESAGKEKAQEAWRWKEAAVLWVAAGDRPRALAAAGKAEAAGPEKRDLLAHFWHSQLGDVYAEGGKYAEAVKHFEKAVEATTIKGYQDACRLKIEGAKKKLAEKP